jgi:hypothetical protein
MPLSGLGSFAPAGENEQTPICPMPSLTLRRCVPMADPMASQQHGQRRMPRARGLRRCPNDGHLSHSGFRASAESCTALSQRFIFRNRKNLVLREIWWMGIVAVRLGGSCIGEWRVCKHSPPSERGVPPGGRRLQGCAFGVGGKGGGGSPAGGRRGMLPHGRFAKALICLLLEWSCACLRRHPAVLPPPRPLPLVFCQAMDIPTMAAPPPSRRGKCPVAFLVPCIRGIPEVVPR